MQKIKNFILKRKIKLVILILLFVTFCLPHSFTVNASEAPLSLDSLQRRFVDLRFGMFLHFNINTYYPDWGNKRITELQNSVTGQNYTMDLFNPTKLDCGQWARTAKAAGMTFMLLTTKHHDGFCLWPSAQTPPNGKTKYTIAQVPAFANRDIVKEYVDSCRAQGLLPGIYWSMWDVANGVDSMPEVRSWEQVKPFVLGQITELLTNYGKIPFFVIDGWSWKSGHLLIPTQEIRGLVKKLQPNCMLIDHNGLTSPFDVDAVYYEAPKGVYCPADNKFSSCLGAPINSDSTLTTGDWFWSKNVANSAKIIPTTTLLNHLTTLESRFCTLILNCPPNRQGLLDSSVVQRLTEFGKVWKPNPSRALLPTQMRNVEYPITPDTATASSAIASAGPIFAIDGKTDVNQGGEAIQKLWRTSSTITFPQWITLDLGSVYDNIDIFGYLPRQNLTDFTGRIKDYKILVSKDNVAFTQVASGTWLGTDRNYKTVMFPTPQSARYVKLQVESSYGIDGISAGTSVSVSELNVGGWSTQPTTGVIHSTLKVKSSITDRSIFMTKGKSFSLPAKSYDANSKVSIFDIRGSLVIGSISPQKAIEFGKNSMKTNSIYIVKIIHKVTQ